MSVEGQSEVRGRGFPEGSPTLDVASLEHLEVAHRVLVLELAVDNVGPDLKLAVLVRPEPCPGLDAVLRERPGQLVWLGLSLAPRRRATHLVDDAQWTPLAELGVVVRRKGLSEPST